jgi:hypothetical protein
VKIAGYGGVTNVAAVAGIAPGASQSVSTICLAPWAEMRLQYAIKLKAYCAGIVCAAGLFDAEPQATQPSRWCMAHSRLLMVKNELTVATSRAAAVKPSSPYFCATTG